MTKHIVYCLWYVILYKKSKTCYVIIITANHWENMAVIVISKIQYWHNMNMFSPMTLLCIPNHCYFKTFNHCYVVVITANHMYPQWYPQWNSKLFSPMASPMTAMFSQWLAGRRRCLPWSWEISPPWPQWPWGARGSAREFIPGGRDGPRLKRLKGGFLKWKYFQNGWFIGKIPLKWMIWGYPHFRKPPYSWRVFMESLTKIWMTGAALISGNLHRQMMVIGCIMVNCNDLTFKRCVLSIVFSEQFHGQKKVGAFELFHSALALQKGPYWPTLVMIDSASAKLCHLRPSVETVMVDCKSCHSKIGLVRSFSSHPWTSECPFNWLVVLSGCLELCWTHHEVRDSQREKTVEPPADHLQKQIQSGEVWLCAATIPFATALAVRAHSWI